MNISGELPQSTLVVAGALWTVLFGLMVWLLISVHQQSGDIKVISIQQSVSTVEFSRVNQRLDKKDERDDRQDGRLTVLESRR